MKRTARILVIVMVGSMAVLFGSYHNAMWSLERFVWPSLRTHFPQTRTKFFFNPLLATKMGIAAVNPHWIFYYHSDCIDFDMVYEVSFFGKVQKCNMPIVQDIIDTPEDKREAKWKSAFGGREIRQPADGLQKAAVGGQEPVLFNRAVASIPTDVLLCILWYRIPYVGVVDSFTVADNGEAERLTIVDSRGFQRPRWWKVDLGAIDELRKTISRPDFCMGVATNGTVPDNGVRFAVIFRSGGLTRRYYLDGQLPPLVKDALKKCVNQVRGTESSLPINE